MDSCYEINAYNSEEENIPVDNNVGYNLIMTI